MCRSTWSKDEPHRGHIALVIALLALGTWLAAGCAASKKTVEERTAGRIHINTGNALLGRGDLKKALAEYELALKADPKNPDAYHGKGLVYLGQGRLKEAVLAFKKSLKLKKNQPMVLNNLANVYIRLNNYKEALKAAEKALRSKDFRFPAAAWFNIGMAKLGLGDRDGAREAFQKAADLSPRFDRAYYQLGRLAKEKGETRAAYSYFNDAVRANSAYVEAHFELALAALELGNEGMAKISMERVLELVPEDATGPLAKLRANAEKVLRRLKADVPG